MLAQVLGVTIVCAASIPGMFARLFARVFAQSYRSCLDIVTAAVTLSLNHLV